MKNKKPTEKFSFWKENKTSGFFQLTKDELIEKYKEWIPTEDLDWHNYYSLTDSINRFISKYLLSIGNTENEFSEYREMEEILKPIRKAYLQGVQQKIEA